MPLISIVVDIVYRNPRTYPVCAAIQSKLPDMEYSEPLCSVVTGKDALIWNNDWISSNCLKKSLDVKQIIDQEALQALDAIVPAEDVELFLSKDWVS